MMSDEGKVVCFNVVQVTSSNEMEKEGFQRCIKELQQEKMKIKRIATDRHTSISSSMDKKHNKIKHQYDVWHLSKWVVKKLNKKAKVKGCEDFQPWIRSISNHLWWSSASCEGKSFRRNGCQSYITLPTSISGLGSSAFTNVPIKSCQDLKQRKDR